METKMKNELDREKESSTLLIEQNELLRHNLEVSQEILEKTDIIKNYVKWQKVWSTVRLLLILVPILIGFLYLPPLIKNYLDQFSSLYK